MSASDPQPGDVFNAMDNPNDLVTIIEAHLDEVRYERGDGTKDTLPRSTFLRDYVPNTAATKQQRK